MSTVQIGRQPILDRDGQLFGYELLFRDPDGWPAGGADEATTKVIGRALVEFGLEELTQHSRAFVNISPGTVDALGPLLPQGPMVLELSADDASPGLLASCERLRDQGYDLALDDYCGQPQAQALLDLVDMVKLDMLRLTPDQLREFGEATRGKLRIAERVETPEQHELAMELGFELFQGYYFARPVVVETESIEASQLQGLRLLAALQRPDVDVAELDQLIRRDPGLCLRLMRYVNSAGFARARRINDVRHALLLLGPREVRRWASLAVTVDMASQHPPTLAVLAIQRARHAELLARAAGMPEGGVPAFLLGMFSLLDVFCGRNMEELLPALNLPPEIEAALLGKDNGYRHLLALVEACERDRWEQAGEWAQSLGLSNGVPEQTYAEALAWAAREP